MSEFGGSMRPKLIIERSRSRHPATRKGLWEGMKSFFRGKES